MNTDEMLNHSGHFFFRFDQYFQQNFIGMFKVLEKLNKDFTKIMEQILNWKNHISKQTKNEVQPTEKDIL